MIFDSSFEFSLFIIPYGQWALVSIFPLRRASMLIIQIYRLKYNSNVFLITEISLSKLVVFSHDKFLVNFSSSRDMEQKKNFDHILLVLRWLISYSESSSNYYVSSFKFCRPYVGFMLLRMHDFSNKIYSHKINSGDGHDSLEPSVQFFSFFIYFVLFVFSNHFFFESFFSNCFFPSAEEITKCINILFHIAIKKLYLRISK